VLFGRQGSLRVLTLIKLEPLQPVFLPSRTNGSGERKENSVMISAILFFISFVAASLAAAKARADLLRK